MEQCDTPIPDGRTQQENGVVTSVTRVEPEDRRARKSPKGHLVLGPGTFSVPVRQRIRAAGSKNGHAGVPQLKLL